MCYTDRLSTFTRFPLLFQFNIKATLYYLLLHIIGRQNILRVLLLLYLHNISVQVSSFGHKKLFLCQHTVLTSSSAPGVSQYSVSKSTNIIQVCPFVQPPLFRLFDGRASLALNFFRDRLLLFSHYADWAGPQLRLWFVEQGK